MLARIMGAGGTRNTKEGPRSKFFLPCCLFLTIWVLVGGWQPSDIRVFAVLGLSGSALLMYVLAKDGLSAWHFLSIPARLLLIFFCLMPLLQLVPLPPGFWHILPGRELARDTLSAAGDVRHWQPITLSFQATLRSFLIFVWLSTFLLALLQLSLQEMRHVFRLILGLGLLNVAVGVVQVVSGGSVLQFDDSVSPFLIGLFANKNHTGLFLAIALLAGYVAIFGERGWNRSRTTSVLPLVLVLMVALFATLSRAGVVFGFMALAFLIAISVSKWPGKRERYVIFVTALVALCGLVAIAFTTVASRTVVRFGEIGDDLRWSIWQWSWPLAEKYFPVGGGIGSFTSLFPPDEKLGWVKPTIVNHVHNDYIEQIIEVGVAAPIFWLLIVVTIASPLREAWAERMQPAGRMATIGAAILALIALHSTIDYPLRRPAIAACAMVAVAALLGLNARKRRLRITAGYARQAG